MGATKTLAYSVSRAVDVEVEGETKAVSRLRAELGGHGEAFVEISQRFDPAEPRQTVSCEGVNAAALDRMAP